MANNPHHHLVERALQLHPTPDNRYLGRKELEGIIHTLIRHRNDTALEQLLEANDHLQHITLSFLAMHGYLTLIRRVHIPDRSGKLLCHFAIIEGHLPLLDWFYRNGYWTDSPLWFAARYGHVPILAYLLDHDHPLDQDMEGWEHTQVTPSREEHGDPITAALQYHQFHILEYLEERGWAWTDQHHRMNQQLPKPWVSPKSREIKNKNLCTPLSNCLPVSCLPTFLYT